MPEPSRGWDKWPSHETNPVSEVRLKMPRKSPFRTLFVVYFLAILAGVCEFFAGKSDTRMEADIYGDPKRNYSEVMGQLYPGHAEAEYLLGRRYEATSSRKLQSSRPLTESMPQMIEDLRRAAEHYERAIRMGLKSEESLYYNYALTLMRIQADPSKIDAAVAEWRREFPYSTRRDLAKRRVLIERELRELKLVMPPPSGTASSTESMIDADSPEPVANVSDWTSKPGYVGSQVCRECHPKQFEGYQHTNHARTLTEVHPEHEPPDTVFDHAASGRRYRVTRTDEELILEESLLLEDGSEFPLTRTPARYRVGSGHFARTYACDAGGGFFMESPITWYESRKQWGMTPGYDRPGHRSFSRQILENCFSCHTGQTSISATSSFRLKVVENSIGCERCHGPGQSHVSYRQSARDSVEFEKDPIVDPRKLSRKLSQAICQQCHLQGDINIGGLHVRQGDYRPGEVLEHFVTLFRTHRPDAEMTVVGHSEQFEASECYRQSRDFRCATCHDPHSATKKSSEQFRAICSTCHSNPRCNDSLSVQVAEANNDCVRCHMPKATTEVPHLAFTQHRIGVYPAKPPSSPQHSEPQLIPLSDLSVLPPAEQEHSLKLAQIQMLLMRGPSFVGSEAGRRAINAINPWIRNLPPEQVDSETEFLRNQFLRAQGDELSAQQASARLLIRKDVRSEEEAEIREQLGDIEFQNSRYADAFSQFRKLAVLRCKGRDWFYLGLCYERLGNKADALKTLERARELEPAAIPVYEAIARIQHELNDSGAERNSREQIRRLRLQSPRTELKKR